MEWCELWVSSIHTLVRTMEVEKMEMDLNRPLATSCFVNSRFFCTQAHVPQKGGRRRERGENEGCSCEVTPHAEIVVSVSGRKG